MNFSFILSPFAVILYEVTSFPLIRLQPIIDLFTSLVRASAIGSIQKKQAVPFGGYLATTKNKPQLIPTSRRLFGFLGKIEKPFSLFRRGRLKNALCRFPGLGFNLLAAPSHQPQADSDLHLRLSSPLQWRDRAGFSPDFPDAQSVKITKRKLHREKFAVKSYFFSCPIFFRLHLYELHSRGLEALARKL